MTALTEKEFTIIDRIGNNSEKITQRQIAQHTGFSLGLTNIILKRLAHKGYIKIRQLTLRNALEINNNMKKHRYLQGSDMLLNLKKSR